MKYCCFDIGNVLCHVDSKSFLEELSEALNISIEEASRFLKRFQQLHDIGYTTMEDELKDTYHVKSPITIKKLVNSWNNSITTNFNILDALNDLRATDNLQVALLSNIGIEHAEMMKDRLNHYNFFDTSIKHFSCFVGARKPSMVYYQSFLLQYPEFKGSLYVDDLQDNLDAGSKFGFKPFKFDLNDDDYRNKINELKSKIVNS